MAKPLRLLAQFLVSIITIEAALLLILTLLLSSCATLHTLDHRTTTDSTSHYHMSEAVRHLTALDSIYRHDSIYIRYSYGVPNATYLGCGGESGDTGCFKGSGGALLRNPVVERVDTVFMEKFRTEYKFRDRTIHDTLRLTDTLHIQHTDTLRLIETRIKTQKEVPRFYRTCTLGFFLLLIAIIAFIALRFYLRR